MQKRKREPEVVKDSVAMSYKIANLKGQELAEYIAKVFAITEKRPLAN